jgi:hypothetical protein
VPNPDRLEEIQRELAQLGEQVARLQREATDLRGAKQGTSTPVSPSPASARPVAFSRSNRESDAERALEQFADRPVNPADVKRGCITAFTWGMVALIGAVVAVYFAYYR